MGKKFKFRRNFEVLEKRSEKMPIDNLEKSIERRSNIRHLIIFLLAIPLAIGLFASYFTINSEGEVTTVFNYSLKVVENESNLSDISSGDVLVIQTQENYEEKDTILFLSKNGYSIDRIDNVEENGIYQIQDYEQTESEYIIGKVKHIIPQAGWVVRFYQAIPIWGYLLIELVLLAIFIVPDIKEIHDLCLEEKKSEVSE